MTTPPLVHQKIENKVATLTIDRPQALNALNHEGIEMLTCFVKDLKYNADVSLVVVRGGGQKAFVAGADIAEMKNLNASQAHAFATKGLNLMRALEHLPQLTLAAVNGFALGGGCELALACDMVVASSVSKFGQPEVNLGLIPGFGGSQRLPRKIPRTVAMDLLCTGRMLSAQEALSFGLVSRIFETDQFEIELQKMIESVLGKGPQALRRLKYVVREGLEMKLSPALDLEKSEFALCFDSNEAQEGMQAFLEKRKPKFI